MALLPLEEDVCPVQNNAVREKKTPLSLQTRRKKTSNPCPSPVQTSCMVGMDTIIHLVLTLCSCVLCLFCQLNEGAMNHVELLVGVRIQQSGIQRVHLQVDDSSTVVHPSPTHVSK